MRLYRNLTVFSYNANTGSMAPLKNYIGWHSVLAFKTTYPESVYNLLLELASTYTCIYISEVLKHLSCCSTVRKSIITTKNILDLMSC